MKWVAKAAVQKAISYLPARQRINHLFQQYVTKGTVLTEEFAEQRFTWAAAHLEALERLGATTKDYVAVELGSGWFPIVPLCLYLHGASRVLLCDIDDLGRPELTAQALDAVISAARSGALARKLPHVHEDRIEQLVAARAEVMELGHHATLARLGLEVRVGDVRELRLNPPADLICSNTVFEHIDPEVLRGILVAFRTNSGPGTVMNHLVDLCDHYAYMDDVSVYQYLGFSERRWKLIDNSIQPMNRLRVQQYVELYARAGVEISEERRGEGELSDLAQIELAAPFDSMDPVDVACKSVWFVTVF